MTTQKLRVGIIGGGGVSQIIHLPTLSLLSHLYSIEIVCDISEKNAQHCAQKFHVPKATTNAEDVFTSSIDVVFILTSDEFHEEYTIAALRHGKHVMLEKPITLSLPSAQRILDAERASDGKRVFVGYMRRYAASFVQAFKREVATLPRVLYARSRDFSGPNDIFTSQSGAFEVRNTDFPPSASDERNKRLDVLYKEAFEGNVTAEKQTMCRFLGSLGSHDISVMRETLGMPESVSGVSVNDPFYSAIFNMRDKTGQQFSVTYESGIDGVPFFDAHLTVYGETKRVTIKYDTPFVKGLAITVQVEELNSHGEIQKTEILSSYEDAYTAELQEMHACFTGGREIKTTVEDAMQDLQIFDMLYKQYDKQQVSIG